MHDLEWIERSIWIAALLFTIVAAFVEWFGQRRRYRREHEEYKRRLVKAICGFMRQRLEVRWPMKEGKYIRIETYCELVRFANEIEEEISCDE